MAEWGDASQLPFLAKNGLSITPILGKKRGRMNIIVSFLAILELMKTGMIAIRQDEIFGEILIDSLE